MARASVWMVLPALLKSFRNMAYPAWIDEYGRSIHQAFAGMVPSRWSSLDGFKAFGSQQGASFDRLEELRKELAKRDISAKELFKLFSTASTIRAEIFFLAIEYARTKDKEACKSNVRSVFDWLDEILSAGMREDKWVLDKNIVHSSEEIAAVLSDTPWIEGNIQAVKGAGKVYVSAASVGFALYRDFFPQEEQEVYGPCVGAFLGLIVDGRGRALRSSPLLLSPVPGGLRARDVPAILNDTRAD